MTDFVGNKVQGNHWIKYEMTISHVEVRTIKKDVFVIVPIMANQGDLKREYGNTIPVPIQIVNGLAEKVAVIQGRIGAVYLTAGVFITGEVMGT